MPVEATHFAAQDPNNGCASVRVCRADALVTEALTSILIGLQAVEGHRQVIAPMLDREIKRLARRESDAARLAAMILSQFAHHPA